MWRDIEEIIKKLKKYKNTEILEKNLRDPNDAKFVEPSATSVSSQHTLYCEIAVNPGLISFNKFHIF